MDFPIQSFALLFIFLSNMIFPLFSSSSSSSFSFQTKGASQVVDVENIKHIAEDSIMVGDAVEKITEEWNVQKQLFYEQTGLNRQLQGEYNQQKQLLLLQDGDDSYSEKLEQFLSETS